MAVQHTPIPWRIEDKYTLVRASEGEPIAQMDESWVPWQEAIGNAAFIVQAVNAHDALVAALEVVENVLDNIRNPVKPYITIAELNRMRDAADQALDLVRGRG